MGFTNITVRSRVESESLEPRMLLSATATAPITPVNVAANAAPTTIALGSYFSDPTVPGTAVQLETPEGNIPLALTDSATPNTVANFVKYINSGEYADTVIHRSIPGAVIQGGGFLPDGTAINSFGPISSEAGQSNVEGTIAMALSTGPNSATSQWFINLADNSNSLDGSTDGGPYTVFGNVVYNGMTVAEAIAPLPTVDDSVVNSAWNDLPAINYSGSTPAITAVPESDLVTVDAIVVPALSYTVSSSNPSLVNPTVSYGSLSLAYGSGSGLATVSVTATDLGGGTASATFPVFVGAATVTVGAGGAKMVRFNDPNGTSTRVSIKGPGSATISLAAAGLSQSTKSGVLTIGGTPNNVTLDATGVTTASTLTITGSGGDGLVHLAALDATGSFKAITAPNTQFADGGTISGSIGTMTCNSLAGAISVTSIGKLTVKGAMSADVTAATISSANAGSLSGDWAATSSVGDITAGSANGFDGALNSLDKLSVKGTITDSIIDVVGNIDDVQAGGLDDSRFVTGAASTAASGSISSVAPGKEGYVGSTLVCAHLGKANLGAVTLSNGGTAFGVATEVITSLLADCDGKKLDLKDITSQTQVTSALSSAGITAQDFNITII